jgi:phosphoribosyl 1,2-cyclic phosphodiesterase
MRVKFWGVRGSIPTPGPKTMRYGGNTSCIEFYPKDDDTLFIIDCGTGIRELGLALMGKGKPINANIFLSHTHWDHIHGFPFFVPAFIPGNKLVVHGPVNFNERLEDIVSGQMKYTYFPVKLEHMAADIKFVELKESTFECEGVKVTTQYLNHPILVLGYRFEYDGKIFVTEYDTEPYQNLFEGGGEDDGGMDDLLFGSDDALDKKAHEEADPIVAEMNRRTVEFARDADLLILDAQYTAAEYPSKIGWGHGTIEDGIDIGCEGNIKRVAFFHHDPTRFDDHIEELEDFCAKELLRRKRPDVMMFAACEGVEIKF